LLRLLTGKEPGSGWDCARQEGALHDRLRARAIRAAIYGVLALCLRPRGFTAAEHTAKFNSLTGGKLAYTVRQSAYDLKRRRRKGLVVKSHPNSRRSCADPEGSPTMNGLLIPRHRVFEPLLKYCGRAKSGNLPHETATNNV
jgi:hypothetical protein